MEKKSQKERAKRRSPLGRRLKALREERNLTHEELAEQIGKVRTSIVQYERELGGILPPLDVIEDLAAALDVSPAFLAYGVGDDREDPVRHSFELRVLRRSDAGEMVPDSIMSLPKWWVNQRLGEGDGRVPSLAMRLEQDAPFFGFAAGDLAVMASSKLKPDNGLYVITCDNQPHIVRCVSDLAGDWEGSMICDGFGVQHRLFGGPATLGRVLGAITPAKTFAISQ